MMTDSIADMLTRIRNAQFARKSEVIIPFSKMKKAIADILLKEEYVQAVSVEEAKPANNLKITLTYLGKEPKIQSLVRESTPGHRKYVKSTEIPRVLNDYGIAILSTSQGVMTNKDARKKGLGGELICSLY